MGRTGENIYKRKDGRWEGRYIFSYCGNGKAKCNYVYARTYSEVKSKLQKAQKQIQTDVAENVADDNEKYEYWLEEWLRSKKLKVKESTYIRYRNMINNHIKPELGEFAMEEISSSIMEQFVFNKLQSGRLDKKGGISAKTMSDILVVIKESFKYAQSCGMVSVCNFDRITVKKFPKEMRVLSNSEEQRLLSILLKDTDRYKLGVFICLFTGIRIGELCALQWKNISLTDMTLKIEKTMQRLQYEEKNEVQKTRIIITDPKSYSALRIIPLPDFITEIMRPFAGSPDTFVLSGESGSYVEPRTMQNRFKSYLEAGEIANANFHALRHTFATRCIEAGFDVKTLSEILGHSSVKITLDKYVHSSMQMKRDNMEKLSLQTI